MVVFSRFLSSWKIRNLQWPFETFIRPFAQYKVILYILSYLFYLFFWAHNKQAAPSDGQIEKVVGFMMNFKCRAKGKHSLYTQVHIYCMYMKKMIIDRNKDGNKDANKVYWFIFLPEKKANMALKVQYVMF